MQSSHRVFLLGILLGGVASVGAGFLIFDAGATSVRADAIGPLAFSGEVQAAAPEKLAEAPTYADEDTRASASDPRTTKVEIEVDPAQVDQLIAGEGVPALVAVTGTGSIWGRIRDKEAAGVAGVVVRARGTLTSTPRMDSPALVGQDPPALHDLEATVREAVEMYKASRENLFETPSDANGTYRFDGLPEGTWRMEAFRRDWVISVAGDQGSEVTLGTQLDFEAKPVLSVPVEVFLADGRRAEAAVIECKASGSRDRTYAWDPAQPNLRLTPGRFELAAMSGFIPTARGDKYDSRSKSQSIELEADRASPHLRFDLESRSGIRGRLTLPRDGVAGDNPRVAVMPLGRNTEPDLAALATSGQSESVRGGMSFAFLDLQPGRYLIGASRTYDANFAVHEIVEVSTTIVTCDLEIPPMDLGSYLVAAVTGADGRSLEGVDFSIRHTHDRGSNSWGVNEMRDAERRYLIPIREEMREAYFSAVGSDDSFELDVSQADHGRKTVSLQRGQTEVHVSFAAPARLEVMVEGYAGGALEGRIMLGLLPGTEDRSRSRGSGNAQLSSEGVGVFDAVEPGPYKLTMRLGSRGRSRRMSSDGQVIHSQSLNLLAGPNSVRLAVPPLYEVVVSAPDAEAGTTMQLSSHGDFGGRRQAEIGSDGRATFEDVASGSYTLQCRNPFGEMEIEVPCGVVAFESRRIDALRVSITNRSGRFASAGLLDGDVIVAVDGEEFESQEDFVFLWRKRKAFDVTVLRAGQRVELRLTDINMREEESLGGSLEPTSR